MSEFFKDWSFDHWQYLHGKPTCLAGFKTLPEHFIVTENLGFELTGEGENLFLLIEKRELNTQQVCEYLAKFFGKRLRDIGYAGLKDKQSVSRQWFSVQMNVKAEINLDGLETENIKLLTHKRHNKKLKIGVLAGNHFDIRLTNVSDFDGLTQRLEKIKQTGVPSYFGEQRFGFKGNNLNWADRMASGEEIRNKKVKSFALSASRSYLFNQVVSQRIEQGYFDKPSEHEVFILAGSQSYFSQQLDDTLTKRLVESDVLLSAPLFGKGELESKGSMLDLERQVSEQHPNWIKLLVEQGLKQERRAIHLQPENMDWKVDKHDLIVSFDLPSGCFATAVLREATLFTDNAPEEAQK